MHKSSLNLYKRIGLKGQQGVIQKDHPGIHNRPKITQAPSNKKTHTYSWPANRSSLNVEILALGE
jgi:hypothetical protein